MISAAGIGSGLDVDSIVSQLMEVEQQPLLALQRQQAGLEAELSAIGQLKGALSTFQTAMQDLSTPFALKVFTATSSDAAVFTATATNTAAASSMGIEVLRLAERHKFSSKEFLDTDTVGGKKNDSLSIQVGPDAADTLTVDLSSALTLGGVRDAINTATDNPGVTATLIFGNDGNQKLILTADNTGADNALELSYGGKIKANTFDFQELNNIAGNTDLLDAEIRVDGYNVTRSVNTIDDVIQGVTLDLHSADPGNAHTLEIERDTEAVAVSVQAFADAFNGLRDTIDLLRAGDLEADSILLSIERRLFSIVNTPATGLPSGLDYLTRIGLSFLRDGTMIVDEADLDSVLANDFDAVSELLATDAQGFANRLETQVGSWLETDGLLEIRTDSIDDRQRLIETREEALQHRLDLTEVRYYNQFNRLDTLLGNLQITSDYLAQQLQRLPDIGSS